MGNRVVRSTWTQWLVAFMVTLGGVGIFFMAAQAEARSSERITVYLAGDSTMASYAANRAPLTGWGQLFGTLFNDEVTVDNRAVSGRSSKSFIDEGRLKGILDAIQPGDYLFIQFAHNDAKRDDPARYTNPNTTFKSYIQQYIDGARGKGAHPVLVTPMHRRRFDPRGRIIDTHGLYPFITKQLGTELDVPVIDLHVKSKRLFEEAGVEGSKKLFLWVTPGGHPNYPNGIEDNTHFSDEGALALAELVAEGIKEADLPLAKYLRPNTEE